MVLSGVLTDDAQRAYHLVRIGGVTGALYVDSREFRPDQVDTATTTILSALPTADAKGRTIDEADLDLGFALGHAAPPAMKVTGNHLWVRIGAVWGYIDTKTRTFWPADVDAGAFAKWENRRIGKDGYYEGGTLVPGKWYLPFPDQHPGHYLFVGGDGRHEWARSQDNTGSGKGSMHTIGALAKPRGKFDVSSL
jgi:hypothetical protein